MDIWEIKIDRLNSHPGLPYNAHQIINESTPFELGFWGFGVLGFWGFGVLDEGRKEEEDNEE